MFVALIVIIAWIIVGVASARLAYKTYDCLSVELGELLTINMLIAPIAILINLVAFAYKGLESRFNGDFVNTLVKGRKVIYLEKLDGPPKLNRVNRYYP
jgi:hypothetical protein